MEERILLFGITGNVGSEVFRNLSGSSLKVRAAVRDVAKAQAAFGNEFEYCRCDIEDPSTFAAVLDGVNKVFLVRPPAVSDAKKYFKPFTLEAKLAGVRHIVFLSLLGVEKNPFPPHYKIERYIKESGIPYTFLRPGFFMQNLSTTHCEDIRDKNEIFLPCGQARVSFVDVRDIGEAGAKVLLEDGHQMQAYTLTGPEALTYQEVADLYTEVLGRKISYTNPSPLLFRRTMLSRGIEKPFANVMTVLYLTTRFGMARQVTTDLPQLLGHPAATMRQFVSDHRQVWMNE